ncbi:tail protein X [Pseudobacteriovorax antillogorgiicola]|uniref:p2-like prophage tail protein X n=1 Tax=Pseudobacteriovorax antillogorgiicola TaxID=1513793 RepID=A0A1Y6CZA6_9BACT|nr:tail protein X [Pseudobacteriovorax antillogorgiicola]TCS44272.1 phage tail protein X [Pseudobacteriovorax antillogorgiicola]SMF84383.1 P2-like prophage tail protein X [Pseudobacteriovorax antillogorgiicola]
MAKLYRLKDGDEIDALIYEEYGFTAGAFEEVLRANQKILGLFPRGRYELGQGVDYLLLPELKQATQRKKIVRLFT